MENRWDEIKALFHAAVVRPPDARAVYLEQACAGDERLRAEVESLLLADAAADSVIATSPAVGRALGDLWSAGISGSVVATLPPGAPLGRYQIIAPLGAGGMGEVYRARDTRLDRTVAIKVLPAGVALDPQARERFEREARAVASLNHPHICTLHDVGNQEGIDFLVMEFLDGETLAARLTQGALPMPHAVQVAIQILLALDTAHRAGIVHRDLKPGNVFLVRGGGASALPTAKLLDFGLAKVMRPAIATNSAAMTGLPNVTTPGLIVGTVQYMAPEQIEGKEADARTDIFAVGTVLFEMLTGKKAFEADSNAGLMAAILEREPPPLSILQPLATPALDRLVKTCLAKDPDDRWQTARDLLRELQWLAGPDAARSISGDGHLAPAQPGGAAGTRRFRFQGASAAVILAVAAALATWWFMSSARTGGTPSEAPMLRLTSDGGLTTDPAVSPDGKLVAYASDRGGAENLDIWLQQVDGGAPLRLTADASDEYEPSFSPDGSRIVFRSDVDGGGIYTIPALGGEPRLVAKGGRHARFSPDGTRMAFVTGFGGHGGVSGAELFIIPSTGGTLQKLAAADVGAANPVWSPDGKWILFARGAYRIEDWAIVSSDLGEPITRDEFISASRGDLTRPVTILELDGLKKAGFAELTPSQWLPGDRLLFSARSGDTSHVFEIGLSPPAMGSRQWRLESSPQRLTFGTGFDEGASLATSGSASGARRMVFASVVRKENLWSLALDADHPRPQTKLQQLTQESGFHIFPSISSDGTRVALISHIAYNDELWRVDLKAGKRSLLSTTVSVKFKSQITADGSQVFYGERASITDERVYVVSIAGGAPRRLCEKCSAWVWDWSPDRRWLLTYRQGKTTVATTVHDLETGKSSLFLERPPTDLYEFRWSPDGRWVTFVANYPQGGNNQRVVYVAPFTGNVGPGENSWIPITDGSTFEDKLSWSPNGNWIYALSNRDGFRCIWAYRLDPQSRKPAGAPMAVFHFHGARLSANNANGISQELSVARDKIVLNLGEITGNIWMTELQEKK